MTQFTEDQNDVVIDVEPIEKEIDSTPTVASYTSNIALEQYTNMSKLYSEIEKNPELYAAMIKSRTTNNVKHFACFTKPKVDVKAKRKLERQNKKKNRNKK